VLWLGTQRPSSDLHAATSDPATTSRNRLTYYIASEFLRYRDHHKNPLGPDPDRGPHRARHDVGRDAVGGLASGVSGAAGRGLVRPLGYADLSAARLLLVVVFLSTPSPSHLLGRYGHRGLGRVQLHRISHHHIRKRARETADLNTFGLICQAREPFAVI